MGQIRQPTLLPYAGSMEPPITSIFHSAAALTIKLNFVEDYLTWRTQFTSLLLSHEWVGFVDSSISTPHHALLGLGRKYDTLVGIITHFPGQLSVEELRIKLLLHEQCLQHFKELDSVVLIDSSIT
ncbi:hypothetical protein H5410_061567 [Solanum commersonii]|uniref:Retrotransposon Copia-like N-terminal domain-containing protein n=1 Tax=Solanum commersonii TaxID=4109 RepID=A0A9J5W8E0_SOLCO|nr:hypothetical protein H5410_061567 [Solanum commersonii]